MSLNVNISRNVVLEMQFPMNKVEKNIKFKKGD